MMWNAGLCPKGDDPMTPSTGYRTITLNVNSLDVLSGVSGNLLFHFNGQSFWFPVGAAAFDAYQCELAFQNLRNIYDVVCSMTHDLFNIVYTIELRSFPVLPYETSIYTNDGNPPLESFACTTDEVVLANPFNSVKCWVGETGTDKAYPGEKSVPSAVHFWSILRVFFLFFFQSMLPARTAASATSPRACATASPSSAAPTAPPTRRPSRWPRSARCPPARC